MLAGEIHNLRDFGFRYFMTEHADNRDALFVDGKHDLERLGMGHAEKPLKHMHDELHRCVIVIQKQHLVERRSLGLGTRRDNDRGVIIAIVVLVGVELKWMQCHTSKDKSRVDRFNALYIDFWSDMKRGDSQARGPDMPKLQTIGFDADDTLWHNERFFRLTQERFASLLAPHTDEGALLVRLQEAEERNLGHYGFGIKGFVLSMIETAIEVTGGRVPGRVIGELLEAGQDMLQHPIDLLPHAEEAVREVADAFHVVLITKGDLLDQERKLAQSGLGDMFDAVEIVSDKTSAIYTRIFDSHGSGPDRAAMVGNSMRSDVLPVIAAGGWGIHVPQDLTWAYEVLDAPGNTPRLKEIPDLSALPSLLREIARA